MNSNDKLVKALTEKKDHRLEGTIRKARRGDFNDYFADSATPIHDLVTELRRLGFPDLAQRAIDGEFDGTPEEADAWAKSPEGQAAFRDLVEGR